VQLRAEAKDYRDIEAILRDGRITLPTGLAAAPQSSPHFRKWLKYKEIREVART